MECQGKNRNGLWKTYKWCLLSLNDYSLSSNNNFNGDSQDLSEF
jgi:hypothetical protein